MRKFKKGAALVITMALSLSMLAGCGDSKNVSGTIDSTSDSTSDSSSSTSDTTDTSDLTIDEYIAVYAEGVTLGDYIGIEYVPTSTEVTDDDVQEAIDTFVEECGSYEEDYESAAQDGDTVNIDFVGSIDGVEFDGGSTDGAGYDLELGSGSLIDTFEDQIVGHYPGETFDVEVTFPDDYGNEELNGQAAVFTTTLNYIEIPVEAEYSDELVAANTDYSTMEEYEAYIREYLQESYEETALSYAQNDVMTNVINKATIDSLPQSEVESLTESVIANIESAAENYGIEYATYIYYFYGYSDEDEFYEYVVEVMEESVKEKMVVCAIAQAEGVTVTDDELQAYIETLAESYGTDTDTIEEYYSTTDLLYYTLADKIMEFLLENAVQVESVEES